MENLPEGNFAPSAQEKIEASMLERPKDKVREIGQKLVLGKSFIKVTRGAVIKS